MKCSGVWRDLCIMGSAKQDLSKMEIGIQTFDRGEALISIIGIPFSVSTRIHRFEDYLNELNKARKTKITDGLASVFLKKFSRKLPIRRKIQIDTF